MNEHPIIFRIDLGKKCIRCGKPGVMSVGEKQGKICQKCFLINLNKLFAEVDKDEKSHSH